MAMEMEFLRGFAYAKRLMMLMRGKKDALNFLFLSPPPNTAFSAGLRYGLLASFGG